MSDVILSEAPADYGPGRTCHRGVKCETYHQTLERNGVGEVGRLSRYTEPHWGGVLLCNLCDKKRVDLDLKVYQFVPSRPKMGRVASYPLPNLREIRKGKGLRQQDLAREVECGTDHIKHIEHNDRMASCKLAGKMARALGVDVRALRGKW